MKIKLILFTTVLFCLYSHSFYSQQNDTLKKVLNDKELFDWVERFIVDSGYVKKNKKGFEYGADYTNTLSGRYTLHEIEQLKSDTVKVILYRFKILSTAYRPGLIARLINTKSSVSKYYVFGISPELDNTHRLYTFFEDNEFKFTDLTKLYCYNLLLYNYYDYINREVGVMPKKQPRSKKSKE